MAELVGRIDNTVNAKSIVENFDGTYTITTCNIKYLTSNLTINGVRVLEIVENGDYQVKVQAEVVEPLTITQPRYYHGTAISVNTELMDILSNTNRPVAFPMIYFPETRKPTRYPKLSNYEMEADCRLVFAVEFLHEWDAGMLKDYCINPMLQLLDLLKTVVDNDFKILIDGYSVEQFSKLGEKVEGKGVIFNAINDNMSGIVVDFTMSVAHDFECLCCCPN